MLEAMNAVQKAQLITDIYEGDEKLFLDDLAEDEMELGYYLTPLGQANVISGDDNMLKLSMVLRGVLHMIEEDSSEKYPISAQALKKWHALEESVEEIQKILNQLFQRGLIIEIPIEIDYNCR